MATTASAAPKVANGEARTREYETIYILRSAVAPDAASALATRVREIIENQSGRLLKVDNWGRRRLAYPIGKANRGVFVYLAYAGQGGLVAELERNLRLNDQVIRYQTVVTKAGVALQDYSVDEADLQFRELEVAEEEEEPELAQRLGLVERPRPESSDAESEGSDDRSSDGGDGASKRDDSASKSAESASKSEDGASKSDGDGGESSERESAKSEEKSS